MNLFLPASVPALIEPSQFASVHVKIPASSHLGPVSSFKRPWATSWEEQGVKWSHIQNFELSVLFIVKSRFIFWDRFSASVPPVG